MLLSPPEPETVKPRSIVKPDSPFYGIKYPARTCPQQFFFFLFPSSRGWHFPPDLGGIPFDHYRAICQHHSTWLRSFSFPEGPSVRERPHQDHPGDADCHRESSCADQPLQELARTPQFSQTEHRCAHKGLGPTKPAFPTGTPKAPAYLPSPSEAIYIMSHINIEAT